MLARLTGLTLILALVVACGGGSTTTAAPTTPPVGGDAIDMAGVNAAINALQTQASWQFEVRTITQGTTGGVEQTVTGTERTDPEMAVDATHRQPDGSDFRYVRIGDDIWFDVGTGTFTQVDAADAENLIEQYEPYYLSGLADSLTSQDVQFELVGQETVSGIATNHYRLSQADRENIVETMNGITADQWGGDVWIATDGDYMVSLAWGPQSTDTAQVATGFNYGVTAVNCECPIEPPA
jgi:hypothetical protein